MDLNLNKPIAFFDLETTGIDVVSDRIVEIAILKVHPDGSEEEFHELVNPTVPIPKESSDIHGITDDKVKDAPVFKDLAQKVLEFIKGCDLGGYNHSKFDIPLLKEELLRCELELDLEGVNIIDAQIIFYKMEPRTLAGAYKYYCDQELKNAHSAMADTRATLEVFKSQLEMYNGRDIENNSLKGKIENNMDSIGSIMPKNDIDSTGRIININGEYIFGFGKHRNKKVKDILRAEPGYYDWIMRSDFALQTKLALKKIKMDMLKDSF